MQGDHDLVDIARIWSRPEMVCYVSALEAEGILTHVGGNHFGNATQEIIAMGGYLVRVPAAQVEHAVLLTAELRLGTEPLLPARSLRRRIWMLVAFLTVVGGGEALAFKTVDPEMNWPMVMLGFLNVAAYPFPIASPGDYRSQSGRMMQLA
jgi:hypothetical protein